ncbi:MAG: hypothetical protein JNK65_02165 [Deltaproteobacteria bacterium]|nr:hypothetical protein [Deltaproteobacteria bacterium]
MSHAIQNNTQSNNTPINSTLLNEPRIGSVIALNTLCALHVRHVSNPTLEAIHDALLAAAVRHNEITYLADHRLAQSFRAPSTFSNRSGVIGSHAGSSAKRETNMPHSPISNSSEFIRQVEEATAISASLHIGGHLLIPSVIKRMSIGEWATVLFSPSCQDGFYTDPCEALFVTLHFSQAAHRMSTTSLSQLMPSYLVVSESQAQIETEIVRREGYHPLIAQRLSSYFHDLFDFTFGNSLRNFF